MEDNSIVNPTQLEVESAEAEQEITPVAAPTPAPPVLMPENNDKKHYLKKEEPKIVQFSGRATEREAAELNELLTVRSTVNGVKKDIVRVALEMKHHIEKDIFQTFKTKKKN